MLKCTVFLPQPCHFCGEEITIMRGLESGSLVFHSLDGNHDNWEPSNKVPAHVGCHHSFHTKGDKNPMKNPKSVEKMKKTKRDRYGKEWFKDPEAFRNIMKEVSKKGVKTRRDRYGLSGVKDPEAFKETMKQSWIKRKEDYGPTGMKDPEAHAKAVSEGRRKGREKMQRDTP